MKHMSIQTVNVKQSVMVGLIGLGSLVTASSVNAVELLNLMVSESGMQRITYEEMQSAGADLRGLKNRRFNITVNGEAVPMLVKGQERPGRRNARRFFGPGGYIEFYAESSDSLYTSEQAYTLHFMNKRELRRVPRKQITNDLAQTSLTAPAATSYTHTLTVEENNYYDFAAPSANDPWHFGQTFSFAPTPDYAFTLEDVVNGTGTAKVEAQLYGLLDFPIEGNDHHYELEMNGLTIGDRQFDGNSISNYEADNVVVNEGENIFRFNYRSIAGVPFDIITLNKFSVSYERNTIAQNGYLEGRFNTGHAIVSGINTPNVVVYRKGDDGSVARLSKARPTNGSVVFNTSGIESDYIVVAEGAYRVPRIRRLLAKDNIKGGTAEYLIIAHNSLMGDALTELVELRSQQYSVKVVDVDQVYAQFGAHVPSADAIYDYIKFAEQNLDTRFVVLVGNDTYDYKKFQTQSVSLIPTRYVTTPGGRLIVTQTPSDASFGDLDGDRVPDLPVGRISARTPAELQKVINKIKAYDARDGYAGRVLMASDKEDSGNGISFTQDAEAMVAAMPRNWRLSVRDDYKAYPDVDGVDVARQKMLNAINAGVSVVSFVGHSSHRRWSFTTPPMLISAEIELLTNVGKPSLVTQWGCWNSYYVDPAGNTMADEFLLASESGAATVLGASTLTSSTGERALGVELNRRMYEKGLTIGEAVIQAKQALAQNEDFPAVQLGWQIIGDPALVVNQ